MRFGTIFYSENFICVGFRIKGYGATSCDDSPTAITRPNRGKIRNKRFLNLELDYVRLHNSKFKIPTALRLKIL